MKKKNEEYFNSMLVVDNNLNIVSRYDKKKLVPFGEFLPFENFLEKFGLKKITPGYSSFTSGKGESILEFKFHGDIIRFFPFICYEIMFPNLIEKDLNEFNFLINISEGAWFGESIGPYQHFSKSIFRSIESGKYLIRSANMGKSVFIDPNGRVIKALESIEAGNIELEIPLNKTQEKQYKKSLIFLFVLFTYVITYFILRRFKI